MQEVLLPTPQAPSKAFQFWPLRSFNHNVAVSIIHSMVDGVAWGVWSDTALSVFVYELTGGSNLLTGVVDGLTGVVSMAVALPIGWVADRWPRRKARLITSGALLTPVAIAATAIAVIVGAEAELTSDEEAGSGEVSKGAMPLYGLLLAAMAFWGIVWSIGSGPAQALLADSTPTGDRSRLFTINFVAGTLASAVGPLLTVIIFLVQGAEWRLPVLRDVILAGLGLELVSAACLCWYRDSAAIRQGGEDEEDGDGADDADAREEAAAQAWAASLPHIWLVPYVLFGSSLLVCLGSGATVKFFPLFFRNACGMGPIGVQLTSAGAPLAMALFSGVGERMAKVCGRVPTMTLIEALGVGCLALLALLAARGTPPPALVAVYLVRTGLMNCTYPLEDSVLMDFVPPKTRARWQSLDSISSATWAGSAALGGLLADRYGYSSTFMMTAALQGAAVLLRGTLVFIVPCSERPPTATAEAAAAAEAAEREAAAASPPDSPSAETPGCINADARTVQPDGSARGS